MIKLLAFDVSETLQTGSKFDDNGLGQPMVMGNEIIPGAYSVLVGGQETAKLLKGIQDKGVIVVLVTNNGADLDKEVIQRTLEFFKRYGVVIAPENYMGPPPKDKSGSKVPRLESILQRFNITKEEILFFDDSSNNVSEARSAGFQAIQVKTPENLQNGILDVINALTLVKEIEKNPPVSVANAGFFSNTEWDQFDADFKAYVSVATRPVRNEFYNHITTGEYWRLMTPQEHKLLIQDYSNNQTGTSNTL